MLTVSVQQDRRMLRMKRRSCDFKKKKKKKRRLNVEVKKNYGEKNGSLHGQLKTLLLLFHFPELLVKSVR